MSLRCLLAISLVLLPGAVTNGLAQQLEAGSYSIRGFVIVPSNQHRDNFEVLLKTRDGEQDIAFTNVDISGRFNFFNLSRGYYDVVIRLDGYREAREHVRLGTGEVLGESGNSVVIGGVSVRAPYDLNIMLTRNPDQATGADDGPEYSKKILEVYSEGLKELVGGHPEVAVTRLEEVVSAVPGFYDAHFNLGLVYQELHRIDEAQKEFRKAHSLNPESAGALVALGRLFVEDADIRILSGQTLSEVRPILTQAREALSQATILDPKHATGFYFLGVVDFRFAFYTLAEPELKRALELDPFLSAARIMLINVYVQQQKWQNALENTDTFILENPNSPFRQQVLNTRASVVRRMRSPE